jgi:hypothetical protein
VLRLHQQDMVHRNTGCPPAAAAVRWGCWAVGVHEGPTGSTSDAGQLLWVAVCFSPASCCIAAAEW